MNDEQRKLTDKLVAEINKYLDATKPHAAAYIIPNEAVLKIAKELGMTPQQVFDAATFHTKAENK